MQHGLLRILLEQENHPPLRGGVALQAVRILARKGEGRAQVRQHRLAPAPRAARLAHEGLAVEEREVVLIGDHAEPVRG